MRINSSNQSGVVMKVYDDVAMVDINGIQFRVNRHDLVHTHQQPKKTGGPRSAAFTVPSVTATADIRGMRAGEAIAVLDKAISDALVSNLPYLTVIHGKGTGALRQAVHEYLKEHPSIQSYRLGAQGEGDAGVTQIELR